MSFGTVVNCMDGRTQLPVNEYIKTNHGVSYVDAITEPGVDGLIAESGDSEPVIAALRKKIEISVGLHGSSIIGVAGHHDCDGNPVDEETHVENIRASVERIKGWYPDMEVVGLWVGEDWKVEKVA
ncbi:MAG: carbonic anhydrase [Thermodesulfobacteriota bacterium]